MTTKLTLAIEKSVIEHAKMYASRTGRSLSELIQTYLESLSDSDEDMLSEMSPRLKRLFGAAKIPTSLDHKKEVRKILLTKKK